MSTKLDVPVTLIFFNRPDTLEKVFEAVREARPEKLYLVCDGPRADRPDDIGKVIACRQLAENVDWPCKVEKIYAAANMGCKERVHTGISAVLEKEECTIILEDDVVPVPDFFTYCRDMLEAYKNDRRVMMISGTNLVRDHKINGPYCFSCFSSIWGWATWRRAWSLYDPDVTDWPEIDRSGSFRGIYGSSYFYAKHDIMSVYTKKKDTWDIQWDYCRHKNRGLGIVPAVNLIENIGFDREDATHTKWSSSEDFSRGSMEFPLPVIKSVKRDTDYDRAYIRKYYGVNKAIAFIKKRLGKK